jgi:hypothetical protein
VQGNNRTASTALPRGGGGGHAAAVTLTLARESGRARLHHRELLRRVLTGEAAKDDQTGGQAGKQATCKGKAKAGRAALLVRATQRSYLLSDCY